MLKKRRFLKKGECSQKEIDQKIRKLPLGKLFKSPATPRWQLLFPGGGNSFSLPLTNPLIGIFSSRSGNTKLMMTLLGIRTQNKKNMIGGNTFSLKICLIFKAGLILQEGIQEVLSKKTGVPGLNAGVIFVA